METHLTLSQLSKLIPGRPSPAKLVRWHRAGVKSGRVKLRLLQVGGRYVGTAEWVDDFLTASREPTAGPQIESPRDREKRADKATKELEAMGW